MPVLHQLGTLTHQNHLAPQDDPSHATADSATVGFPLAYNLEQAAAVSGLPRAAIEHVVDSGDLPSRTVCYGQGQAEVV
ncbi:MAG: hypothetical protein ACYSUQ_07975, partial [Planctomycetota bacterium]